MVIVGINTFHLRKLDNCCFKLLFNTALLSMTVDKVGE